MCGVTDKEEKYMKIYLVMIDSTEYHEGEYLPEAAFTDKKAARKYEICKTYMWGNAEILEVDIEATDKIWVVTSEEAYGSGEVWFRKAFVTEEEAETYAKEINDDKLHERTTLYNADVHEVSIDEDLNGLDRKYEELCEKIGHRII